MILHRVEPKVRYTYERTSVFYVHLEQKTGIKFDFAIAVNVL